MKEDSPDRFVFILPERIPEKYRRLEQQLSTAIRLTLASILLLAVMANTPPVLTQ